MYVQRSFLFLRSTTLNIDINIYSDVFGPFSQWFQGKESRADCVELRNDVFNDTVYNTTHVVYM